MAVTLIDLFDSNESVVGINNPSIEKRYAAWGTLVDSEVATAVEAALPAFISNKAFQNYRMKHVGDGNWEITATYNKLEPRDTNVTSDGMGGTVVDPEGEGSTYTFDTTGGTQKITQTLSTVEKKPDAGQVPGLPEAPDCQGAIGVTGDSVEGTEITVPVFRWSESHYIGSSVITKPYRDKIARLTGKVNNATFRGYTHSEVLFLGASGSQRRTEDWQVSFHFAHSPTKTNISIGGIFTIAEKRGWEYLWIRYEDGVTTDGTGKKSLIKRPTAAYVEKVYEHGNFADLGIGTA